MLETCQLCSRINGELNLLLLTSCIFWRLMWCNVQKCIHCLGGQRLLSATAQILWSLCGCRSVLLFFCSDQNINNKFKCYLIDVILSKCGEELPLVAQPCSWCAAVQLGFIVLNTSVCNLTIWLLNEMEGDILHNLCSPYPIKCFIYVLVFGHKSGLLSGPRIL